MEGPAAEYHKTQARLGTRNFKRGSDANPLLEQKKGLRNLGLIICALWRVLQNFTSSLLCKLFSNRHAGVIPQMPANLQAN
jgi:hypothetical protein